MPPPRSKVYRFSSARRLRKAPQEQTGGPPRRDNPGPCAARRVRLSGPSRTGRRGSTVQGTVSKKSLAGRRRVRLPRADDILPGRLVLFTPTGVAHAEVRRTKRPLQLMQKIVFSIEITSLTEPAIRDPAPVTPRGFWPKSPKSHSQLWPFP